MLKQRFPALQYLNFRLFWWGQLVSLIGTWMQTVAMAWLVLHLTNSPLALGTVLSIEFTPFLLMTLWGGVIADRYPKQRILVATQTVMLAQASLLAGFAFLDQLTLIHLYLLAAVLGVAEAIDNPTRQAFVRELVPSPDLPNAVSLNSTAFNTAKISGPALGGIILAIAGAKICFLLNALSFGGVIFALLKMQPQSFYAVPVNLSTQSASAVQQIQSGIRYAIAVPKIAQVLLVSGFLGVFGYNLNAIVPLVAQYVLKTGPAGFGGLTAAAGIGSLAAALLSVYLNRASRKILLIGAIGFSLSVLGLGVATNLLVVTFLLVSFGFCGIIFFTSANSLLQLETAPDFGGRIMSIYVLLITGTTPMGSLLLGWLAQHLGVRPALLGFGLLCGLGVGLTILYGRWKHLSWAGVES
jgi:MFS family permease